MNEMNTLRRMLYRAGFHFSCSKDENTEYIKVDADDVDAEYSYISVICGKYSHGGDAGLLEMRDTDGNIHGGIRARDVMAALGVDRYEALLLVS